ncbi:zinc finger protein 711-like [Harmonia axyridis]|uniref:zinc finger protein 711-like n=1 Tax=Harmonia axyridis TaxID=115357 RepID=UPI001E27570B|nr:zinc finger protein 711-like [Harmonia axyridis]
MVLAQCTVEIIQNKHFSICTCTYLFSQLKIYEVLKSEMEVLDETNHHKVKMEMGVDDESYEKGNSFDLGFQYTTDGGHIDEKTEIMDIAHHYTDENGIRSSIKYEIGEFALNQKNNLEGYIAAVHLNDKEHKCHLCDYASNQKVHLKIHIDSIHLNKREHKCHLCEFAANQKVHLKIHIDSIHLNKREHKCHLCEFAANRKTNLKKHLDSVHLNKRKHKCHLCDYAFNRKTNLKKAETKAEKSTTKRILRTTEMKTLETITGYKLADRMVKVTRDYKPLRRRSI